MLSANLNTCINVLARKLKLDTKVQLINIKLCIKYQLIYLFVFDALNTNNKKNEIFREKVMSIVLQRVLEKFSRVIFY